MNTWYEVKVEYTREQAEEVLRDFNKFQFTDGGALHLECEKFLNHKFPEPEYVGNVWKGEGDTMFLATEKTHRGIEGFGFDYYGDWIESTSDKAIPFADKKQLKESTLTQATEEEWKEALIKEAKRKFKVGDNVKCLTDGQRGVIDTLEDWNNDATSEIELWCNTKEDWVDNILLMKNGKWAEIVEEEKPKDFFNEITVNGVTYVRK